MLQSMGSQRVGHDLATEQQQHLNYLILFQELLFREKLAHTHTHTHRVKDSNTPACSHKEIDSDSGYNGIVLIELNLPCVTILKAGEKNIKTVTDFIF